MRFSLKDLFWAMTLIAMGVGLLAAPLSVGSPRDWPLFLFWWFGSGAMIGAGLGAIFRRKLIGAWLGSLIQFPHIAIWFHISGFWLD